MTQEEKARAYDEALEKARARYDKEPTDGYVGYANQILKELFPTLAESEDERIRKALIDGVRQIRCKNGITQEQMLTWLEKQKEHQNKSMAHEDSSWSGILTSPLCKDKNLDDIAQEYVEGVKEYNPTPDWNLVHTAVCYGYHLAEQKEQKPEWSEEDEEMLNRCISSIEETKDNRYYYKETDGDTSYDEEIAWLKSLPLNLKKKNEDVAKLCSNEWSEEDEKYYNWLCMQVHCKMVEGVISSKEEVEIGKWMIKWLNHAPNSSWKPSDGCLGIKGHPDPAGVWKPSEEQMKALRETIEFAPETFKPRCTLESLLTDLKKLEE